MKLFLTSLLFIFTTAVLFGQSQTDSIIVFKGYIFTEDSIPIENVYLINYRDTKMVTTDSTGHFSIVVQPGDSLMINHLTLQPRVIHARKGKANSNKFYVQIRNYTFKPIATRTYSLDYLYFKKNVKKIYRDLERLGYRNPNVGLDRFSDGNPYDPDRASPGVGISLSDIIRLFKRK